MCSPELSMTWFVFDYCTDVITIFQLVMDGIAFPVALLVLAYVLRSLRLLIIPVINMVVSILTAFMIALPIAYHMV